MYKRRFGLRTQFILLIVAGLSAMFVAIAIVTVRVTTNNLRDSLVNESKAFAALATKPIGDTFVTYKDSGTLRITQQIAKFTDLNDTVNNVSIVDVNGELLFEQGGHSETAITKEQASSFEPIYIEQDGRLQRIIYPHIEDFGARRYSVVYTVSYDSIDKSIRELTMGILGLAALALVIAIGVTYLLISKLFLAPLSQVSAGALAISKGNLNLKIEPKRNDEIGDLAVSVSSMADALKADIEKLKEVDAIKTEFMMIASHNLRTPLTIIQGYLDNLLVAEDLSPDVRKTIEVVSASGNRLSVFAEDILTVSRLEAGEKEVMNQRQKTDLRGLLKGVAKDFTALAKEKNLEFESNLGEAEAPVLISTPHFRAAIWNLLDNALKFTKEGKVGLDLQVKDEEAIIAVSDTGSGIAPEEIPKLFTKFHRGTSTLEYNFEGTGIGLYLTKLIVEQHGGRIAVDTQPGKGTTMLIRLPLASASVQASEEK